MKSALAVAVGLPPPPAGPLTLTRFWSPCARSAANACVPLQIQRVNRHIVLSCVVRNLFPRPVCQWTQLQATALERHLVHVLTGLTLASTQANGVSINVH